MTTITIKVFPGSRDLSIFAADLFSGITQEAVLKRGRFLTVLSGGGTPTLLFRLMAQVPYCETLPWGWMNFFWGDERCVAPDDVESCYGQAYQTWLKHVALPVENIYRIKGELGPVPAAEDYARQLKNIAEAGMDWPRFDLVLLGLGADGHTASLFPGSQQTKGVSTVAVNASYQDRPALRVSLTPDVINSAHNVVFLATGNEKAQALADSVSGKHEPSRLPAQRIRPVDGNLFWLVDEAAASLLPELIEGVTILR